MFPSQLLVTRDITNDRRISEFLLELCKPLGEPLQMFWYVVNHHYRLPCERRFGMRGCI
jgi:hypothetical protein